MEQEEPEEQTGRRGLALTLTTWKEARLGTHDPLDMCLEGQDNRTRERAMPHAPWSLTVRGSGCPQKQRTADLRIRTNVDLLSIAGTEL